MSASGPEAAASAVLLRDATRASRRWQTYAVRMGFTGLLLGGVLLALHAAISATTSGLTDVADLGWLGRGLFVSFVVGQLLLALFLAPLTTASAVVEETDERTLELLVLTRLTARRVLGGLVLARLLGLLTVVAGALPVMTLVVTLGGVSAAEVVTVTVQALATVVMLGAFFGLYTRSPMLATFASAAWVIPAFWFLPTAYAIASAAPWDTVRFSPFVAPFAEGWGGLLLPISFAPAMALVWSRATRAFALTAGGAEPGRLFSDEIWRTTRWLIELLVLACLCVTALPVLMLLSYLFASDPTRAPLAIRLLVEGLVWAVFVAATYVGTWAWLRVGAEMVDAIDRIVGPRRNRATAGSVRVWGNPVAWREARPRAWGATTVPILATWAVLLLTVGQSYWWLVPGGLVVLGAVNGAAAVVLGIWLAAHTIASERHSGTLSVLLTTRMTSAGIVGGKLLGVGVACLPLLGLAAPMLLVGVPYAGLVVGEDDANVLGLVALGAVGWVWLFAVWLAGVGAGMIVAMRIDRPQTAFAATVAGLALPLLGAFLAGRLLDDLPLVAVPARLLAPPVAGGGLLEHAIGACLATIAAATVLGVLTKRLRSWAVLALLCLPVVGEGAEVVEGDGLSLRVEHVGDGWIRGHGWTALHATIANAGPATTGTLSVAERGASDALVRWSRGVDLADGARKTVRLRFRPDLHARPREVHLRTDDGRALVAHVPLQVVTDETVTIAVIGEDHLGLTGLTETWTGAVPGRRPRPIADAPRPVRTGLVPPAIAPDHAADWSGFDWIVWPDADPSRLTADQLTALRHAVADGGHLLLTVTDGWRRVATSPLADLLPVTLTGAHATPLAAVGLPDTPLTVATAELRALPARSTWTRATTDDGAPLHVTGTYGLGTVHVLLVDPRALPHGADWRALLSLPPEETSPEDVDPAALELPPDLGVALNLDPTAGCVEEPPTDTWSRSPAENWAMLVRKRLSDIPGVAPIPLGWLVLFSGLYLIAIGPLDYLVLRAIGRQPLTWLTFPLTIAVFSGVALVGTSRTKGSQAVVTRLEVLDWLPGTDLWRGDGHIGVFSTRKVTLSLQNGFSDAVLSPHGEAGFMTEPVVGSTPGPTQLAYGAETWTLAYARSAWVEPLGGGAYLRGEEGSWEIVSDLPFPLVEAWVVVDNRTFLAGPLAPGEVRRLRGDVPSSERMIWARMHLLDIPEGARAHLHTARGPVLIGLVADPVESLTVSGLQPVERSLVVARVPLR